MVPSAFNRPSPSVHCHSTSSPGQHAASFAPARTALASRRPASMRTDRTCTRSPSAIVATLRRIPLVRVTTARKDRVACTARPVREHDHRVVQVVAIEIANDAKVVRKLDDRPGRGTHRGRHARPATLRERHRPQALVEPGVRRVLQFLDGGRWRGSGSDLRGLHNWLSQGRTGAGVAGECECQRRHERPVPDRYHGEWANRDRRAKGAVRASDAPPEPTSGSADLR